MQASHCNVVSLVRNVEDKIGVAIVKLLVVGPCGEREGQAVTEVVGGGGGGEREGDGTRAIGRQAGRELDDAVCGGKAKR
eukprot:6176421-Pleurochrysis_carterae.AAC.3